MHASSLLETVKRNWKSGIAVSLVSLPLAISLAIVSGADPIAGIITAIWACTIASIFGGSHYNIIGPAGALSGILAAHAMVHGAHTLPMLALLTGIFIFFAYLFKLERYLIFFPASTIHGFILGVALTIGFSQINSALGLVNLPAHNKLLHNVYESCTQIPNASLTTFGFFLFFLLILFIAAKLVPQIPGAIVVAPIGIGIGALSAHNLIPFALQTLQSQYPSLHPTLMRLPRFSFSPAFLLPSLALAVISILETMILARMADGLTHTKHNKRKEMLGLSLANIVSGLFGGFPATAALARTTLNIKTGASNKISATISGIGVAVIAFLLLSFFKYIPLATIAAMLVYTSIRMVERKDFARMYKSDKKSFFIALSVAFITVYEDPIVGLLLGATVAMLIFMEKISLGHYEVLTTPDAPTPTGQASHSHFKEIVPHVPGKKNILIYAIKGQLAYINAQSHSTRLENAPAHYKHIILDLDGLHFIDLDGIDALCTIINDLMDQGRSVALAGLSPFIQAMLNDSATYQSLKNTGSIFTHRQDALDALAQPHAKQPHAKEESP